jgi:hypothetical protein
MPKTQRELAREVKEILAAGSAKAVKPHDDQTRAPTPETLQPEQIEAAFAAGKIDYNTRYAALLDPSRFSGSDIDAIMFAKRTVCQAIAARPGRRR